jgi:cyclic pyranopterin monophosphate synthase
MELTHFDDAGRARMVDVSGKPDTAREAVAAGEVHLHGDTLARIRAGGMAKGDVLAVAQVAGIMAAKRTADLVPMCHLLLLTGVELAFELDDDATGHARVGIRATVRTLGKTGAEMEALTAVSVAALTIYDMCKALSHDIEIVSIRLLAKSGGRRRFTRTGVERRA